ncbi:MAG: tryptophan synthase subunit alpha [Acidimicrobiia bacterium]
MTAVDDEARGGWEVGGPAAGAAAIAAETPADGGAASAPGAIEAAFRAAREAGRKLLVPYLTGGLTDDWCDVLRAVADAGADAVEIGIPFSDPVMDGPVIQLASAAALERGTTPASVLDDVTGVDAGVPLVVMTYANVVHRAGARRFAGNLVAAGVAGAILPDLPLEELDPWSSAADAAGVETILLAAPVTPDERLARIAARSRGWVYAVGLMGVTGERAALAASATLIGARLKAITDRPVLIGVGISTPAQAVEAADACDGVIVGSALVRIVHEAGPAGDAPARAADFVGSLRRALDGS